MSLVVIIVVVLVAGLWVAIYLSHRRLRAAASLEISELDTRLMAMDIVDALRHERCPCCDRRLGLPCAGFVKERR